MLENFPAFVNSSFRLLRTNALLQEARAENFHGDESGDNVGSRGPTGAAAMRWHASRNENDCVSAPDGFIMQCEIKVVINKLRFPPTPRGSSFPDASQWVQGPETKERA
jgi:hypothetical protein